MMRKLHTLFLLAGCLLTAAPATAELLTFTAPNGSWATAQAIGVTGGARSVRVVNPLAVPVWVRLDVTDADSGAADARVDAGAAVVLSFVDTERPGEVAVYGDGGTGTVYVEAYAAGVAVEEAGRVTVGLSSATPGALTSAGAAGTSALGSRADHSHPLQTEGSIAASLGTESGNAILVTLTVKDQDGTTAGSEVCEIRLFTAAMAAVDGSSNGAFDLTVGTALTTDASAANIRMWATAASGVLGVSVIDKSGSLTGDLILVVTCPGATTKVQAVTFA